MLSPTTVSIMEKDVPDHSVGQSYSVDPKKILVVDDEEFMRLFCQRALTMAGYDVFTVADGIDCLNFLDQQPVDLVVSDVSMPRMDGVELLEKLRIRHPKLKFLFTSGSPGAEPIRHAQQRHTIMMLPKPFTIAALFSAVGLLVEDRHASE